MKRRLGTALLALALLQMLLPATALAAEADNIVDTSALEYFEIPLIDPRDPPAGTTGQLEYAPNADQAAGADHIVDASELEYFEIPLIDSARHAVTAVLVSALMRVYDISVYVAYQ